MVRISGPTAGLTINLTYDADAVFTTAGLNAGDITNMKAAMTYAATEFTSRYNDPINVNIRVTAVAGTGTLGQSSTSILGTTTWSNFRSALNADKKTADDTTAVGATGSIPVADPVCGGLSCMVYSRAQAKALGLLADDLTQDGIFTFGGGFSYTYDPNSRTVVGKTDFIGVAMHEMSEIMGRISSMGHNFFGTPNYIPFDLFHYTAAGTRGLNNGAGRSFSIDNGTTLLKAFNDASLSPGSDLQDWASGTNDTFNAFSSSGVQNDLSAVDVRVMDAIGYDRTILSAADVSVSGRVVDGNGRGLRNVRVSIADSRGNRFTAVTNTFGYYVFASVPSGDTYMASASARGMTFGPRVVNVNDAIGDLNFIAQ